MNKNKTSDLAPQRYIIWIDSDQALLFNLTPTGIKRTKVERKEIKHHTHNDKDSHTDPSVEHFYRDLSTEISHADEILIFGPGLSKQHFKTHLETHHPKDLAQKIIGVETCDHPTEKQILALAGKFYVTYDLFNHPIEE